MWLFIEFNKMCFISDKRVVDSMSLYFLRLNTPCLKPIFAITSHNNRFAKISSRTVSRVFENVRGCQKSSVYS